MTISRRHTVAALASVPLALAAAGTASATPRPVRRRTVFIASDSTAATKSASAAPETGWGMTVPFFLARHVAVSNHAVNGRSSRSFIEEGRLEPVLEAIRPGDFLLVQFGHNDSKTDERHTDPWTTYQDYLRTYVAEARRRGAHPVLITPVERRRFDDAGHAYSSHGDYPEAMRVLAEAERVPLVDLQAASIALWERLGPEGTKDIFLWLAPGESPNHPDGVQDNTHFGPHGAIEVARLVARGLKERRVLPPGDLRRLGATIPDSAVTW